MTRLHAPLPYAIDAEFDLPEDAHHHWIRVLRARLGDTAELFDGSGQAARVELIDIHKRGARVRVLTLCASANESPLRTHLGQVMSKGERLDYALQKAVELGVSEITLLTSERCELKLRGEERVDKKLAHWQRVIIGACEQSGRNTLPLLHGPISVADWQVQVEAEQKWVLAPAVTGGPQASAKSPISVALLIGPEGGLSDGEIQAAQQAGFQPWQLGPRVLRTETAPVAALSVLQLLYGDYKTNQ
ncbi:MAG: 16S rRNA (uracil(1498)-N(3))-methyltransferase [Pseudomonadota bacterium]